MLNEIITLLFAVAGMIFTLWFMVLRLTSWRITDFIITIPIHNDDPELFDKIYATYSMCDFCKLKKKCTIALVNYGASSEFCETLTEFYKNYPFIKLLKPEDLIKELHT